MKYYVNGGGGGSGKKGQDQEKAKNILEDEDFRKELLSKFDSL